MNPEIKKELIDYLRSLANLLDKAPTETEAILGYIYDVQELIEHAVNHYVEQ